jgi:tight adherence protein B
VTLLVAVLIASAMWCARGCLRSAGAKGVWRRLPETGGRAPTEPRSGERRAHASVASFLGTAGGALAGWLLVAPWAAALGALAGLAVARWRSRRTDRRADTARDEQLADVVGALAAAIRSGLSIPQALAYAADESPSPVDRSLRALVDRVDVGEPLGVAVDRWARGIGSDDARLLAGVLRLHRRSGGDLPAVLDQVGATLRDRRAAAREVRALTAQARLSGAILGFLPIGFFAFLWLTSRNDIEGAFRTPAGLTAVTVGLTLEALAFVWIRHLLAVAP